MKLIFGVLLASSSLFAARTARPLDSAIRADYDACHHWAGEASGEQSPERAAEIEKGVHTDCKIAKKTVGRALRAPQLDVKVSALVLQVVDCCRTVWADKADWKAKVSRLCEPTEDYFKGFSPEKNPDAQAAYLALCPEQAEKIYKK